MTVASLSEAELQRVTAPLAEAWTLPPAAYTHAEMFALETERVFQQGWFCVARADQVAQPGDYLCVDLPGLPLVVARDLAGDLHVISRVCAHRAMPVAQGSGNTTRFVCPYHRWTYELNGQLRSAPMMQEVKNFDPQACALPRLRVELWNGFVFATLDNAAPALAPQLSALTDQLRPYDFEALEVVDSIEFDSPWNWKLLVENFMEAYHHIGTHRDSLEPIYPARAARVPDNDGAPWALLVMPAREAAGAAEGGEEDALVAGVVFPACLFAAGGATAVWYQVLPRGHDAMTLVIHLLARPDAWAAMDDAGRAGQRELVRAVHLEDIEANRGPWQGLHSALAAQGRLSAHEKALWQFNQFWVNRLFGSR